MFLRKGVWAAWIVVEVLGRARLLEERSKDQGQLFCTLPGPWHRSAAVPALPSRRPQSSVPSHTANAQ